MAIVGWRQRGPCGEANSHLDLKAHVIPKENGTHLSAGFTMWEYGPNSVLPVKREWKFKFLCELLKFFNVVNQLNSKTKLNF